MAVDETRSFEIDPKVKPKCKLPKKDNKIEIKITKEEKSADPIKYTFKMGKIGDEVSVTYINCENGYVDMVATSKLTQECGIGKMLMKLCLNDKEIHHVENNVNNKALKKVKMLKVKEVESWANNMCEKFIFLTMTAEGPKGEKAVGHVYFNSAIETDYTLMTISLGRKDGYYPKDVICTTKTLKERYTNDGYMLDDEAAADARIHGNGKTEVWGKNWFFCKPKTPTLPSEKCTDFDKL